MATASRQTKVTRASATVSLRERERRIAVVADTHSSPHPAATKLLETAAPAVILHAGDIGHATVLEELRALAPTLAVRGNIDGRALGLPDELLVEVRDAARGALLMSIFLVHAAMRGPKLRGDVARRARECGADLVVCGHSHVPFVGRDQGLAVFNSGSIGPRRFRLPVVFGLIDVGPDAVHMHHISCDTGERWQHDGRD